MTWKVPPKNRPSRATGGEGGEQEEEARRSSKKLKKLKEEEQEEGGGGTEGKSRNGRIVEKLHPAHCIELREKERGAAKETRGQGMVEGGLEEHGRAGGSAEGRGGWSGKRGEEGGGGCGATRRVSGVVGTPKIASRYDDARSGPILDFSQFASSKAAEQ